MIDAFKTNGSSPPPHPDLLVSGGGTLFLLFATSPVGQSWIDEHLPDDAQWFAGGVAVEHRFIGDLITGAAGDGLLVSWRVR